jgi:hypothetical protein
MRSSFFQPIAGDRNQNPDMGSGAKADANGHFKLKIAGTEKNGAVVGKHRVEIWAFEGEPEDPSKDAPNQKPRRQILPDVFNQKTTLTFDVPAKGTKEADFELITPVQ